MSCAVCATVVVLVIVVFVYRAKRVLREFMSQDPMYAESGTFATLQLNSRVQFYVTLLKIWSVEAVSVNLIHVNTRVVMATIDTKTTKLRP